MAEPRIGILAGPTAVGKTELAIRLAEALEAEIVNADSMQVYRYMDIGTAKATPEEQRRVPHHLLDVADPDEPFDAALYRHQAMRAIRDILRRGKRVLVVGGTGLYIRALVHGLFPAPPASPELRASLKETAARRGSAFLHERLVRVDPSAARTIHPNDCFRIVRALEVFYLTGVPLSSYHARHRFAASAFRVLYTVLNRPREELYQRIETRVDRMMDEGLLEETQALYDRGYDWTLRPLQSIGYRHAGWILRGIRSREETVALLKRDTRRFAKRQITWFKGVPQAHWWEPEAYPEVLDRFRRFLESSP